MNISANVSCQSYFMPIIFRANQISGKDEIAKNECNRAYKSSGMQVRNDAIQGAMTRNKPSKETTILDVDPWILRRSLLHTVSLRKFLRWTTAFILHWTTVSIQLHRRWSSNSEKHWGRCKRRRR